MSLSANHGRSGLLNRLLANVANEVFLLCPVAIQDNSVISPIQMYTHMFHKISIYLASYPKADRLKDISIATG